MSAGAVSTPSWSASSREMSGGIEPQARYEVGRFPATAVTLLAMAEDDEDSWDENATERDVTRLSRDYAADPRAGRLVARDEDTDDIGDTLLESFTAEHDA